MSEWWTYRPSDFLMFSPRTYARLIELYNQDLWPLQVAMLAGGIALLWLAATRHRAAAPAAAMGLAAAWLWVGWSFHWQRFAQINTAAPYLALAFLVEAGLLVALVPRHAGATLSARRRVFGWLLAVAGIVLYPLVTALVGRSWTQAEVAGMMPEPTALATLGLLLVTGHRRRRWLAAIPLLSLAAGAAILILLARVGAGPAGG